MKDQRLEKEFEEYFKGANLPADITADAKKCIKAKSVGHGRFIGLISAAASVLIVCTAAVVIALNLNPSRGMRVYGDERLSFKAENAAYLTDLNGSLKIIEDFARADNAKINYCSSAYDGDSLAFVTADVSSINGLTRHETSIYIEFADGVYSPLEEYYSGTKAEYKNPQYYLTRGVAVNGEPVNKLYLSYGGVKYYFNVTSSDEDAYKKYLQLIVK